MKITRGWPLLFKRIRARSFFLLVLLTLVVMDLSHVTAAEAVTNLAAVLTHRPANWATPLTCEGMPNFFKVSDALYRSAQPTGEGFKQLPGMGIKTVVNLRAFHNDVKLLKNTGLAQEHIQFATWHPETEDIVQFLRIVTDTNKVPVLVHCQYGADRTGTMCAIYRIVVQGWTKDAAIAEMTTGGYGFHAEWANLIRFIRGLDVDDVKKQMAKE